MDTAKLQDLSEKCEKLKELWNALSRAKNTVRLALIYHSCGDINCKLDVETTETIKQDLINIIEAQKHKYEEEIKKIINPVDSINTIVD